MLHYERGGQALLVSEVCGEEEYDAAGASLMDQEVAKNHPWQVLSLPSSHQQRSLMPLNPSVKGEEHFLSSPLPH